MLLGIVPLWIQHERQIPKSVFLNLASIQIMLKSSTGTNGRLLLWEVRSMNYSGTLQPGVSDTTNLLKNQYHYRCFVFVLFCLVFSFSFFVFCFSNQSSRSFMLISFQDFKCYGSDFLCSKQNFSLIGHELSTDNSFAICLHAHQLCDKFVQCFYTEVDEVADDERDCK